jgi:hypothetical protein
MYEIKLESKKQACNELPYLTYSYYLIIKEAFSPLGINTCLGWVNLEDLASTSTSTLPTTLSSLFT